MVFPINKMALTSYFLWVRMTSLIIVIQGGAIIGFILRRKMKKKQAQLDHMRNTFINAMAHEMKTPAAVIKNSSECILEEICPEKNRHYVEMISKETDHMSELISKMLVYTRTADSVQGLRLAAVALPEMTKAVCDSYQLAMEQRGLTLRVENLGMDTVFAEADLIKMVIDNYVSNAVRYAKDGSEIVIAFCKNRFQISNQCEKLTPEQMERIWEPMYVIDESRTRTDGSAGMGLAICKNILELHQAKYGVENTNDGVRFFFEL